jgi:kynureninase
MRFGITPLFVREADIVAAVDKLAVILKKERWKEPKFQQRSLVT